MIRCIIELVPHGIEEAKRQIGLIEIANDGTGNVDTGSYSVALKKTAPYEGALRKNWKNGKLQNDKILYGQFEGFHRKKRGVYDLLYLALKACGLDQRNK